MEYTRITAKICTPLWDSFNNQIDSLFLKRDAFLDNIISTELIELNKELSGKRLSKEGALYIAKKLHKMGTTQVSIQLKKDTAVALNKIVNETYIVRDAFLNRLIMFLRPSDKLLKELGLPKNINASRFLGGSKLPISPLVAWQEVFNDPLYQIRNEIDEMAQKEGCSFGLYTCKLPESFDGFECYLEDKLVPRSDAYKKEQAYIKEQQKLFDLI